LIEAPSLSYYGILMRLTRRSAFEIEMDILAVIAVKPARVTRIFYRANVSHSFAKQHLKKLVEKGLLAEKTSRTKQGNLERRTYSITQKGIEFLKKYQEIRRD
jgi:predicted transcriptional regulator